MTNRIKLIECIKTWQGECLNTGSQMLLCRFKYCNLKCPWCDTLLKMRVAQESEYDLKDLQKEIYENNLGLLCTGGEPTFDRHFNDTVTLLTELDYVIANVETNGYNLLDLINKFNLIKPIKFILSPKIFNDNDGNIYRKILSKIHDHPNLYLKMVYEPDNKYLLDFLRYLKMERKDMIKKQKIWMMPEGATREVLLKNAPEVFDICEKYKFNFSSRSHIIFDFI